MKVLLTGANGQVGFCLNEKLSRSNWIYKSCNRHDLDISNQQDVENVVDHFKPDVIVNAAAYTLVDKAEINQEEAYAVNRDGPLFLAMSAKKHNAVLLHISTDYVFSGDSSGIYFEGDKTVPQGVYGASKLAGEAGIQSVLDKFLILRTSWVFGEHGNNFVKTMIRLGRDREQLGIVSDQVGGPTYAGDIADALLKIIHYISTKKDISWGIYHYSGMPYVSWYDFASEIFKEVENAEVYKKSIPHIKAISTIDYPTPAKRPKNSRLDCSKLHHEFSIEPSDWRIALKNIKAYS